MYEHSPHLDFAELFVNLTSVEIEVRSFEWTRTESQNELAGLFQDIVSAAEALELPVRVDSRFIPMPLRPSIVPIVDPTTHLLPPIAAAERLGIGLDEFSLGRLIGVFNPRGGVLGPTGQLDRRFDEEELKVDLKALQALTQVERNRRLLGWLYPSSLWPAFRVVRDFDDGQIVISINDFVLELIFADGSEEVVEQFKECIMKLTQENVAITSRCPPFREPVNYLIRAPVSAGLSHSEVNDLVSLRCGAAGDRPSPACLKPKHFGEAPMGAVHYFYDREQVAAALDYQFVR